MNTKLNASNDMVVSYLETLWRSNKTVQQDVQQDVQQNIHQDDQQDVQQNIQQDVQQDVQQNIHQDDQPNEQQQNIQPIVQLTIQPNNDNETVDLTIVPIKEEKKKFVKEVRDNLKALREVGFRVYQNVELEKEVNLVPKTVTNSEIEKVYDFKKTSGLTRKQLMTNIAKCTIFSKYKSGDTDKPENFRYLVNHHNAIKIIDRMWCLELVEKCGENLPDKEIYKANLLKNFSPSIIHTANNNTLSIDGVVLLDVVRAFDSLEWDVLEELLLANITRKTNKEFAKHMVDSYMVILKNRELYYNNILVKVSKGIPTGLPSSSLIFTLALEEILYRWYTKYNYVNKREYNMNVYVDDIYMKILQIAKADTIVNSLINHMTEYYLYINIIKSKADKKLNLTMIKRELQPTDYYLGIPFTRDIKLYGQLILSEFKKNKQNMTWEEIYKILISNKSSELNAIVFGFMNYKLKPLMGGNEMNMNREMVAEFIKTNYVENVGHKLLYYGKFIVSGLALYTAYRYFMRKN
jgi:hypothetical protein